MEMPEFSLHSTSEASNTPIRLPCMGFGVYQSPPDLCKASCLEALRCGYRLIDTAHYYENDALVGQAVRESGIPREDIFITTKSLEPTGSLMETLEQCRQNVRATGLDYVDLFLVNSPRSGPQGRQELWLALEKLLEQGGTRAIGVSNYGVRHLEELQTYSSIMPLANQIELHPFCQHRPIVEYCRKNGIQVEAYAPLGRGTFVEHPDFLEIANEHNATPAQILLRWSLQHGFIPLPKSDRPEIIRENADVFHFKLTDEEMKRLDAMDRGKEGAIFPQPTDCP